MCKDKRKMNKTELESHLLHFAHTPLTTMLMIYSMSQIFNAYILL
jgi:hypothetical protein